MTTTRTLPHWDMSVVYPGLDSPEFAQDFAAIVQDIQQLASSFDTHHIQKRPNLTVDSEVIQTFETITNQLNIVLDRTKTLSVYISCFVNTNSHDNLAQARMSELQRSLVVLSQLSTRMTAWLGSLDVEALIAGSMLAQEHAYALRKAKEQAAHLMSPAEESLAAELNVSSGSAWTRLHGNITSQLTLAVEVDGETQELPMSAVRNMAYDTDRDVRRRAYEAELTGWKKVALPLAASMNSIKNEVQVLAHHRHWQSALEASLFANSIDSQTLEAMLSAARASFPDFRRYLHAKARVLSVSRLAWYDLFAPIGTENRTWDFDEAAAFIVEQFGTYSERLSGFAARAFAEHWIDAEPRPGKRDGAYCTGLRGTESRVFANYKPVFGGVSTLAHELGHGYHNVNLAHRTPLQRSHPMTLAETASIFCETIIRHAALQKADEQEQLAILEASLQGSCQIVVDITSRFLFEQRLFEKRQQRELSVDELNDLMLEAQRETYGDGLDEELLHPYMWAMKPHYYSTGRSFYNYPYMFGLLFGLGLYARYQQDPETFKRGYDDLLSSTGMADAATLAGRFGIDLRTEDFWRASLEIIRQDIDQFEALIQK
ncbi:oligoendopeptidase F [Reticulibacter mediterranei]|uniref:Oligoendopeptidase F n=2 Tax=Reticulibacter mediterranei TaxID=2778369 RepID=A0A8J3IQA1_9CHLR|nr:M3 family oligoendopeptidase [Reticulibacter mediterranei]GHO93456.1 oligoendopeptidase F [Reticulibacter mediterranei]